MAPKRNTTSEVIGMMDSAQLKQLSDLVARREGLLKQMLEVNAQITELCRQADQQTLTTGDAPKDSNTSNDKLSRLVAIMKLEGETGVCADIAAARLDVSYPTACVWLNAVESQYQANVVRRKDGRKIFFVWREIKGQTQPTETV